MNLIHRTGMTFQILVRDDQSLQYNELYVSVILCHRYIFQYVINVTFLCLTAKNLVASLMEVDQDQRLTAQEAIAHEW